MNVNVNVERERARSRARSSWNARSPFTARPLDLRGARRQRLGPTRATVRPKPPRPTASSNPPSIEERLKTSAASSYALLNEVIATGVSDDKVVQAIARRARISTELATWIALLNKLPEHWKQRLDDPRAASNHTLAEVLRAARLLRP